jgi:hypothetical protein
MNMKIASTKFLAAILFSAIAIVPLRAQTNAPAENGTAGIVAATNSTPASNAVAAAGTQAQKKSSESSSVRTDNTGLPHIHFQATEGKNPVVDIVAIVTIFGMPVVIGAMLLYFRYRRDKLTHETLLAMIEKGMPITPELLNRLTGKRRPGSPLFLGLLMTGIGTAMLIPNCSGGGALDLPGMGWAGTRGGWIVLFMGVAFLIVWFVERRDKNNNQPPKQQ